MGFDHETVNFDYFSSDWFADFFDLGFPCEMGHGFRRKW